MVVCKRWNTPHQPKGKTRSQKQMRFLFHGGFAVSICDLTGQTKGGKKQKKPQKAMELPHTTPKGWIANQSVFQAAPCVCLVVNVNLEHFALETTAATKFKSAKVHYVDNTNLHNLFGDLAPLVESYLKKRSASQNSSSVRKNA